jgi:hypothetical protein
VESKAFIAWHVRQVVAKRPPPAKTRLELVAAAAAPIATTNELRVPAAILLMVAVAFLVLLVVAVVVLLPERVLPAGVAAAVEGRRENLVFLAACALTFVFLLVLLVALASS